MIKLSNTITSSPDKLKAVIMGARNPMNSWSRFDTEDNEIGEKDKDLLIRLARGGSDDRKFMRMLDVTVNITAPLYWWKEMDQYKVGTTTNSCSTMHKIHANEFNISDFSTEHLLNSWDDNRELYPYNDEYDNTAIDVLEWVVGALNHFRKLYIETKDKKYWWQMIQLLPSSYNQLRTWSANYEVLANIYHARKNHKLDEWHDFCRWIESLPYSYLITGDNHNG